MLENDSYLFYKYIMQNHIQLYYEYVENDCYAFCKFKKQFQWDEIAENECFNYLFMNRECFMKSQKSITELLINLINNDYYVLLNINMFFIKKYSAYQRRNCSHEVMIYGYSITDKVFFIRDFFDSQIYTSGVCSFDEIEKSVLSYYDTDNYRQYNDLTAAKPIIRSNNDIDLFIFKNQLASILHDNYDNVHGYGLGFFDFFSQLLNDKNRLYFPGALSGNLQFIQQHIYLMNKRMLWLSKNSSKNIDYSEIIAKSSDIHKTIGLERNKLIKIRLKTNDRMLDKEKSDYYAKLFTTIGSEYKKCIKKLYDSI